MVGIGTSDVNLDKYRHTFCSLLGKDEDSWGLSYTGNAGRAVAEGRIVGKATAGLSLVLREGELNGMNETEAKKATRPVSPLVKENQSGCL